MSEHDQWLSEGVDAFHGGDLERAIECFERALEHDADSLAAHSNLAGALCESGNVDGGLVHFMRAVELDPKDAELQRNYGYALKLSGNLAGALERYHLSLSLDPDNVVTRLNLANALAADKQYTPAREQCEIIIVGGRNPTAMLKAQDLLKVVEPLARVEVLEAERRELMKEKPALTPRARELTFGILDAGDSALDVIEEAVAYDPSPEFVVLCSVAAIGISETAERMPELEDRVWSMLQRAHGLATLVAIDPITPLPEQRPTPEGYKPIVAKFLDDALTTALSRGAPDAYDENAVEQALTELEKLEAELGGSRAPELREMAKSSGCLALFAWISLGLLAGAKGLSLVV